MSISAAPQVSNQSVGSVPKVGNSPVKFKSKFAPPFGTYANREDSEINDQKSKKEHPSGITPPENDQPDKQCRIKPEIFKLLHKYCFQDFFQLALSTNDLKLAIVIKENRKLRGISSLHPTSNEQMGNDKYLNQAKDQYLNVNWLMENSSDRASSDILYI